MPAVPVATARAILPYAVIDASAETAEIRVLVDTLPLDGLLSRRFDEVINGIHGLPGEGPDLNAVPSTVRWRLAENAAPVWTVIAGIKIGEMLAWPKTGPVKVRALMAFVAQAVLDSDQVIQPAHTSDRTTFRSAIPDQLSILTALRRLAAWGVSRDAAGLLEALDEATHQPSSDVPFGALDLLNSIDLRSLAGEEYLAEFDPVSAAQRVLDSFDSREHLILAKRLLVNQRRKRATLEELGTELGITRERVRQLEAIVASALQDLIHEDRNRGLMRRAAELHDAVGVAAPLNAVPSDMQAHDETLVDELFAWVAGPYVERDGWLVLESVGDLPTLVQGAFERVADGPICFHADLIIELEESGFSFDSAVLAVEQHPSLRKAEGRVLMWTGGYAGKAEAVLRFSATTLGSEEIFAWFDGEGSIRSMKNALAANDRFRRIGIDRWALTEWGFETYEGVVPAMIKALNEADRAIDLDSLKQTLAEKHGIAEASIAINASMHPAFVLEDGRVRLRRDSEPYVSSESLELTRDCFIVDGVWSLRVKIDHDILRGSGRSIPEAFSIHLGVSPGQDGRLDAPHRDVWVGWGQRPNLGSVRAAVEAMDLEEGDFLFIKRTTPSSLGYLAVRYSEIDAADPERRLLLNVGATGDSSSRPWTRRLADALGFGGAALPDIDQLTARLNQRNEPDLASLVGEIAARGEHLDADEGEPS